MGYFKFTAAVMLTCCSFLSAASADGDIFENAGNAIYKLATEYSQPAEELKVSIDSCRKEILRIATSIQPTVQAKLEEIQNNKKLSNDQKFSASEAVIANQKKLIKAAENANSELDNHLSVWIGSVAQQYLCSLDDLYKSASKEPTNAEEIALANIAKQLNENDFMRLARKNIDLDTLEMLATLYAMRDNPRAAYAKYELKILGQKADLDEEKIQRKHALENFTSCIRYTANTALALAEIELDRYDNADDNSLERITLRKNCGLTTAWAIALEEAAKEIPSLQELAKFFRHETAHAVSKKFLENLSPIIRKVNFLRIKAMAAAVRSGVIATKQNLFLTNTSFLSLNELSLKELLGDDAGFIIANRDGLRMHPGYGEAVFLPDQIFNSLLELPINKKKELSSMITIQHQFFDAELDFAASGINELSDFGRLWARYHAMRNLTGTLDAEAFKTHASELLKANTKLFFGTDFTTSTYATAAITSVLNENFWTDPFTKGKTDDESLARLNNNKAQAQATHDLLTSMPDSTAKQLAVRLLGNWVTASVGKTHDEWTESGRDALAIAYLQTQKYSNGTDEFKIWNSIKELAEAFATTKLAEKAPLESMQQKIAETFENDENKKNIFETYFNATKTILNLEPSLGMDILKHAVDAQ
jgi:hypothetical protein